MSAARYETIQKALEKGARNDQLLDGRDFDFQYWRNAKRQLTTLRRELDVLERERNALRAVVDAGAAE